MFKLFAFEILFAWILAFSNTIIYKDPLELLLPQRADILAKYIYASQRKIKSNSNWGKEVYAAHLAVWNCFFEGTPRKNGLQDFVDHFNCLLDSIEQEGFNLNYPIPISKDGVTVNGAHRTTSCLLHKIIAPCFNTNGGHVSYSLNHFEGLGLKPFYLEAMAIQYVELKPTSILLLSFSPLTFDQTMKQNIVFQTHYTFSKSAFYHFIQQLSETYAKYRSKFRDHQRVIYVYLIDSHHLTWDKKNYTPTGLVIDSREDVLIGAKALFNENSRHLLDLIDPYATEQIAQKIKVYRDIIASCENPSAFCLDYDFYIALLKGYSPKHYGVLSHPTQIKVAQTIQNKTKKFFAKPWNQTQDDIIFHPKNYLYYYGLKIACKRSS
jgi:hypothetical protein